MDILDHDTCMVLYHTNWIGTPSSTNPGDTKQVTTDKAIIPAVFQIGGHDTLKAGVRTIAAEGILLFLAPASDFIVELAWH